MTKQQSDILRQKRGTGYRAQHMTSNVELAHYMKVAGVKPVDKDWASTWSEFIRERVASYCANRSMALYNEHVVVPPKPRVVR